MSWLQRARRWWLGRRPIPDAWVRILDEDVPFAAGLEPALRQRLHALTHVFARDKRFVGAGGMEIDDRVRVVISATAVRLVLHLHLGYYDRVHEIVVVPEPYRRPDQEHWIAGEAHAGGSVVLAWSAVQAGLANPHDGRDTASHEFAHLLDAGDGAFDGTPTLRALGHYRPWAAVMDRHFRTLRRGRKRRHKVLRHYGATNEAEFFAVATEAFFEKATQMKRHTPDLYEELRRFYRHDPAA